MSKTFESIDQRLAEFIQRQRMFFVATAPLVRPDTLQPFVSSWDVAGK